MRPRPEVVLGGETRAVALLFTLARPVAEALLVVIDRWYRTGEQEAPQPGSLWRSPDAPRVSGGNPSRDSLLAPLQMGKRMPPHPAIPLHLARNLVRAGRRALGLYTRPVRPIPEVDSPAQPIQAARR